MAHHDVLGIPELLENIISQLPPTRILSSARRVCKQWSFTIETSPTIQQKLHYRTSSPVVEPFLPQAQYEYFIKYEQDLRFNPVMKAALSNRLASSGIQIGEDDDSFSRMRFSFDNTSQLQDQLRAETFDRPKASWKNMFVTDPPCSVLSFYFQTSEHTRVLASSYHGTLSIRDAAGIRFSLVDEVMTKVISSLRTHEKNIDPGLRSVIAIIIIFEHNARS